MKELSYSEILKANQELAKRLNSPVYNIAVLSNVTVNLSKEIFEYSLRQEDINAHVRVGDYDNIVQDTLKNRDANLVIIFWELCNVIDGLQYKANLYDDKKIDEIFEKVKSEIDLVVENLAGVSLVLVNQFSSGMFSNFNLKEDKVDRLADQLNGYLQNKPSKNIQLVDVERIFANIGLERSIDWRGFYSSKSLYSIEFYKAYTEYVKHIILSVNGRSRKALILDCDNTLWKGILGEDGFDNIEMSSQTKNGAIFAEVQNLILSLNKEGVIVGLCSRNNVRDIEEVISSHPDMLLKNEHITIKKINWLDKPQNLREIAQELNIGLESIVFVDDSPFEVNLIKDQLPETAVFQVPQKLHDYPAMFRKIMKLFYSLSRTHEDIRKIEMYRQQIKRENSKKQFSNIEDYLKALALKITIFEKDNKLIPRLSQLSQKTNQFNLTTKRYTEGDVGDIIKNKNKKVIAFSVSDKFGDNGIVGMIVVDIGDPASKAHIESFMMSCRVIGRNIEFAFMDYLIRSLKEENVKELTARYIQTFKNGLTKDFYDKCHFEQTDALDNSREYVLNIDQYQPNKIDYIEVINGNKNKEDYVHSF